MRLKSFTATDGTTVCCEQGVFFIKQAHHPSTKILSATEFLAIEQYIDAERNRDETRVPEPRAAEQ
jgi:hypothetical protein